MVTLKLNKDFKRIYYKGKSVVSPSLVTYVFKNKKPYHDLPFRIGITASKKIGNAVKRNRARRVIREAFRNVENEIPKGIDIVFVARTRTIMTKSTQIEKIMKNHLKSLGIIEKN